MPISNTERMLRLNLQFFGDDGADDGSEPGTDNGAGAENKPDNNDEKLEKLIQAKVDRLMAEERKKTAELQKKVDKMTKEKMSAEEIKKLEDEEKAKELADREKAIADRENRYYALNAVLKADIGVESDVAEEVVGLVLGASNEETDAKIATLAKVVNKMSANKVDKAFKDNGRNPKGSGNGGGGNDKTTTVAETLGKQRAEMNKQATDVLNYYTGGNK